MSEFSENDFKQVLRSHLSNFTNISTLKAEQEICIKSIVQRKDVFGILPTGFGKSLIFQLLPRVLRDLWKVEQATVIVVTPLISIMRDQVKELKEKGMKAFALGDEDDEKDLEDKGYEAEIVYGSAERFLCETWQRRLREGKLHVAVVVIDEVHSVSLW